MQRLRAESTAENPMRWRMLILASMAYACFGLALASIPPLVDPIIADLSMTSGQMGMVLGVWQMVFIGTSSPLGSLLDRWGARRAITLGLILILLSIVLRGLATDFTTLLLAVALLGAGGPIIAAGMPKIVAQWFSGNERGLATGIYVVGRDTGAVFALATAASLVIALTGSWRGIAIVYGVITLLVIALWVAFSKDLQPVPAVHPGEGIERGDASENGGVMDLLKIRDIQLVLVLGFVVFFMNHGLGAWLPTVLRESGMPLAESGRWVAAGIGLAMLSNFAVPSLARKGLRSRWLLVMLLGGALTTAGLACFSGTALIAMVLLGTVIRSPAMQVLTLVLMETPGVGAKRVGAAAGLFFAVAEIGGFTGPLTLGVVRDSSGGLTLGLWIIVAITAVAAVLPLLIRERRG